MLKWATEAHLPHGHRHGSFLPLLLSSQVWNRKRPVNEYSLTHCKENDAVTHMLLKATIPQEQSRIVH